MITELFVEGQRVDLSADLSTLLTFAVDDVKDFGSRNSSFSKTIVLPGTQNNNRVFGHIFEVGSSGLHNPAVPNILTNYNAAKVARAQLFQGNIQIFKGQLQILEIIADEGRVEYEVAVFGQLVNFINSLGNKKLENLDFSQYNTTYTAANIVDSWDNTPGSGVYWPLIDFGNYSIDKHNWDYRTFRPALYVKEYIDKIFAGTRYKYSCPLFETDRFKKLVIPSNTKDLRYSTQQLATMSRENDYEIISATSVSSAALEFETFIGSGFSTNAQKTRLTYFDSPTLFVNLTLDLKGTYLADAVDITIRIKKNGVSIWSTPLQDAPSTIPFETFIQIPLQIIQNDYFEVFIEKEGLIRPFHVNSDFALLTVQTEVATMAPVPYNGDVIINDTLPRNILQKDFFSSILKLFNLYVTEDRHQNNLLHITPYIDYYQAENPIDWTYKLDRAKPIRIKPMSELNSRFYKFNYKSDSDYYNDLYKKRYNETYGSRLFDSEFDFANDSADLELIFAGTPLVGYSGEDKVYSTIFKRTGTGTVMEEQVDSVIRILQTKKIPGVSSWKIEDTASLTTLATLTKYGYAGHLDDPDVPANDLNFGAPRELFFSLAAGALHVNQFNVYYSPYMAEITDKDSKLLTGHFQLSARDIIELDFSKLIHLDGSLWRINKVIDWNASQPDTCKVELLKVINTQYV